MPVWLQGWEGECVIQGVINTHMQASDDPLIPLGYGEPGANLKQIVQLGNFIQKRKAAGQEKIILAGDFNCTDVELLETELTLHKISSNEITHAEDGCIDHVFVSTSMRPKQALPTLIADTESDHKLLMMKI